MATHSYETGVIEVAENVYAFTQENGATNAEIRCGYDAGLSGEDTVMQANVGKFDDFIGRDRVGLITHMSCLACIGDLQ